MLSYLKFYFQVAYGEVEYITHESELLFNILIKSNRKAMKRNWGNQKANPALKTKVGNK